MLSDDIQKQEAGDGSTNLQGKSIVINQGISYRDAKEIALDVFKANSLELSQEAAVTAASRAEKLADDFLENLNEKHQEAIKNLNQPALQMALFDAQKAYVTTGDEDLESLLVDILVERATEENRTIKQITLDESLKVAPKLTSEQFDVLTINFLISKTKNSDILSLETLKAYLEKYIIPFVENITNDSSCYEHLAYAGCGSFMETSTIKPIEELFRTSYQGVFQKGFAKEEFELEIGDISKFSNTVMPHFELTDKLQINALNIDMIEKTSTENSYSDTEKNNIIKLFNKYLMNVQEVKEKVIELNPIMEKLFDLWSSTSMNKFKLTTVGIAIAQANLRSKQGVELDLAVWVK